MRDDSDSRPAGSAQSAATVWSTPGTLPPRTTLRPQYEGPGRTEPIDSTPGAVRTAAAGRYGAAAYRLSSPNSSIDSFARRSMSRTSW